MMSRQTDNLMLETGNVLRAVFVFIGLVGAGLAAMLGWVRVPLSSTDPFLGDLGRLWWLAALQLVIAILGWGLLLSPTTPPWLNPGRPRRVPLLTLVIVGLGLLAGHLEFELRYAQVQARWTAQISREFQDAMTPLGLDPAPPLLKVAAQPDRPFCAQAVDVVDALSNRWDTHRRGGEVTALMLRATQVQGLWDHGCLSPTEHLRRQHDLSVRAERILAHLSYERYLPVWGWPLQTWWGVHRRTLTSVLTPA